MKLDSVRLAHTSALVTAGFYVICWILIGSMSVFYMSMMSPGLGLYGLITMTAVAWVSGYVFAAVYNALGKK